MTPWEMTDLLLRVRVPVDIDRNGCWIPRSARTKTGYSKRGDEYGHRALFEAFKGPIPDGLEIDHLCRNRACINPEHLEAVTHAENMRRVPKRPAPSHCRHGHELTPGTLMRLRDGRWRCRECHAASSRRTRRRRRVRIVSKLDEESAPNCLLLNTLGASEWS